MDILYTKSILIILEKFGFSQIAGANSKTFEYQFENTTLYVKVGSPNSKEGTRTFPLVIHPDNQCQIGKFESILGVNSKCPSTFYHVSSMHHFPSRKNDGKGLTKFGMDFGFETESALENFLNVLTGSAPRMFYEDFEELETFTIPETEKLELRKARIGQGRFRANLIEEFKGTCPCTDVTHSDLLRASHIKPWAKCTNEERLDRNNGLLLAANVDALFDKGYISFDNKGAIQISHNLSPKTLTAFGVTNRVKIDIKNTGRSHYLEYHRNHVFLGE